MTLKEMLAPDRNTRGQAPDSPSPRLDRGGLARAKRASPTDDRLDAAIMAMSNDEWAAFMAAIQADQDGQLFTPEQWAAVRKFDALGGFSAWFELLG